MNFLRVKKFHISSTACQNFYFLREYRGMRLLSSTKVSTILAEGGAVLVFFVNSYKFVFIYIFFDIRIGIIQGVVQMKKLKSCRQDRPLDVQ